MFPVLFRAAHNMVPERKSGFFVGALKQHQGGADGTGKIIL
jgi:hypothetical protein